MAAEVSLRGPVDATRAARRPLATTAVVVAWVPLILLTDRGASYPAQCGLGVATWIVLIALLRREDALTRSAVAVSCAKSGSA